MSAEERYLFDLQGFLLVEDVLEPADVRELNEQLDTLDLWNQPRGQDAPLDYETFDEFFFHVSPPHCWGKPFLDVMGHPRMTGYLREILGPEFRYDHGQAMFMRKGSGSLELHGGGTPCDPVGFYRVADGAIHCGLTVISYALCDVGPGDGGFVVVPGSHKSGFPRPEGLLDPEACRPLLRQVPQRAGSAVIFTEALTHGTLPWTASHERRALLYRYTPGHMAFVGRYRQDGAEQPGWAYPQPSDAADADLTPELRRLLEYPYVSERDRLPHSEHR